MTNLPILRSPLRPPSNRRAPGVASYGHRSGKRAWKYFPHVLVTLLVALFVAMLVTNEGSDRQSIRDGSKSNNKNSRSPPSLHLLGERHSGTKWMTEHLTECFGHAVEIRKGWSAWKHWFQTANPAVKQGIVVAIFRNPYYWVEAMHRFPHHAPVHFDLDWHSFLTKPWTMARYGEDVQFDAMDNDIVKHQDVSCPHAPSFGPHQVIPCLANWTIVDNTVPAGDGRRIIDAFYELRVDGSGQAYDSLLGLRRDKIRNFLSLSELDNVKETYAVQYDDMVLEGTELLINTLERVLGVTAQCFPVKGSRTVTPRRGLPSDLVAYLRQHIDWDTEALIGFLPRDL